MRFMLLAAALMLGACGGAEKPPNPYPDSARAEFFRECPPGAVCDCTWDKITREMTAEEWTRKYREAKTKGLLPPDLSRISSGCKEQHAGT